MKDRIVQFLASEKISPAEFADKIGVQRSSMSHILNGRNYPSAAFIQKMLQIYPLLNSRWLMIGSGSMYAELSSVGEMGKMTPSSEINSTEEKISSSKSPANDASNSENDLFSTSEPIVGKTGEDVKPAPGAEVVSKDVPVIDTTVVNSIPLTEDKELRQDPENNQPLPFPNIPSIDKEIEQILFFYKDKTFTIYRPS
jgi:transcriptional regulator with XRE-family HTH domain